MTGGKRSGEPVERLGLWATGVGAPYEGEDDPELDPERELECECEWDPEPESVEQGESGGEALGELLAWMYCTYCW